MDELEDIINDLEEQCVEEDEVWDLLSPWEKVLPSQHCRGYLVIARFGCCLHRWSWVGTLIIRSGTMLSTHTANIPPLTLPLLVMKLTHCAMSNLEMINKVQSTCQKELTRGWPGHTKQNLFVNIDHFRCILLDMTGAPNSCCRPHGPPSLLLPWHGCTCDTQHHGGVASTVAGGDGGWCLWKWHNCGLCPLVLVAVVWTPVVVSFGNENNCKYVLYMPYM